MILMLKRLKEGHPEGEQGTRYCYTNLCITCGVHYQQFWLPNWVKTTWMHPCSKYWHVLDYIIMKSRWLLDSPSNCPWRKSPVHLKCQSRRKFHISKLKDQIEEFKGYIKDQQAKWNQWHQWWMDSNLTHSFKKLQRTPLASQKENQHWVNKNNVKVLKFISNAKEKTLPRSQMSMSNWNQRDWNQLLDRRDYSKDLKKARSKELDNLTWATKTLNLGTSMASHHGEQKPSINPKM